MFKDLFDIYMFIGMELWFARESVVTFGNDFTLVVCVESQYHKDLRG